MTAWNVGLDEVILFEKPQVETIWIKPSIQEYRHIHFWIKAKDKNTSLHRQMYKRSKEI